MRGEERMSVKAHQSAGLPGLDLKQGQDRLFPRVAGREGQMRNSTA